MVVVLDVIVVAVHRARGGNNGQSIHLQKVEEVLPHGVDRHVVVAAGGATAVWCGDDVWLGYDGHCSQTPGEKGQSVSTDRKG